MITDLFNRFKDHPSFEYSSPPSTFNIERLELELGYELPREYKDLMNNCYSCSLHGEHDNINFWSLGDCYNLMFDEFYAIPLQGFYMIGADGGGNHYVYDAKNKLGRGAFAVYYIGRADLSLKEAVFVGDNLTTAMEDMLDSTESYFERENMEEEVWIQKKPGVDAQYELAEHYWIQKRYSEAMTLIQSIPNNYNLTKFELINHDLYEQLKTLLYQAYSSGRTEANLERLEVEELSDIAQARAGFASSRAGDILNFFYGANYSYYPILPIGKGSRARRIESAVEEEKEPIALSPKLWGYPNPAINWMDISYDLPESHNLESQPINRLIISSTLGQIIKTINVKGTTGVVQLNTTDWSPGIYFATLYCNKTKSNVYKFVIQK